MPELQPAVEISPQPVFHDMPQSHEMYDIANMTVTQAIDAGCDHVKLLHEQSPELAQQAMDRVIALETQKAEDLKNGKTEEEIIENQWQNAFQERKNRRPKNEQQVAETTQLPMLEKHTETTPTTDGLPADTKAQTPPPQSTDPQAETQETAARTTDKPEVQDVHSGHDSVSLDARVANIDAPAPNPDDPAVDKEQGPVQPNVQTTPDTDSGYEHNTHSQQHQQYFATEAVPITKNSTEITKETTPVPLPANDTANIKSLIMAAQQAAETIQPHANLRNVQPPEAATETEPQITTPKQPAEYHEDAKQQYNQTAETPSVTNETNPAAAQPETPHNEHHIEDIRQEIIEMFESSENDTTDTEPKIIPDQRPKITQILIENLPEINTVQLEPAANILLNISHDLTTMDQLKNSDPEYDEKLHQAQADIHKHVEQLLQHLDIDYDDQKLDKLVATLRQIQTPAEQSTQHPADLLPNIDLENLGTHERKRMLSTNISQTTGQLKHGLEHFIGRLAIGHTVHQRHLQAA